MIRFMALCLFSFAFIQSPAQLPNTEAQAKAILNKVSATYKGLKTLKADFSQTIVNPHAKTNDKLSGTVYIKGEKFKLILNNQEIICDNKTIWTYNKTQNEVQINNYEPSPGDINPSNVFNIYEKGFIYVMNSEKKEGSLNIAYIDLTPTDKNKPYFKVRIAVDKNTNMINSAVFMFKDGKIFTFNLTKIAPNVALADNVFMFDAKQHPGVTTEELR